VTSSTDRLSWKARGLVGVLLVAMAASFIALYVTTDRGVASSASVADGADDSVEPAPTDATGDATAAPADRILQVGIVGDSLTEGIQAALPALGQEKGLQFQIDALRGREAQGAAPLVQKVASGKDIMVVALGTNDARKGLSVAEATKLIDEIMLQAAADQRVMWVNAVREDSKATIAAAGNFNKALTQAAERFENLTILDWAAYVQAHKAVMAGDRIHLTDKGYEERAKWTVDQIAANAASSTTTTTGDG
jgi:lysophospholipase L1-like esterase